MRYDLTHEQVYQRYHDTDNEIAKLYWLTKLRERAANGSKAAQYLVDRIEASNGYTL